MPEDPVTSAPPTYPAFQVGDWRVETDLNQLVGAGRTVRIEPKAMAALCCLARHAERVVTREMLLAAVWPGVVVSEDALTQVIVKLRKALGDSPDHPVFIQTISKKGYRLLTPVVLPAGSSPTEPESAPRPSIGSYGWRRPGAAVAMGAILLAAVTALWIEREGTREAAPVGQGANASRMANPTIAIRPFEAIGNDPREQLLARGVTADVGNDLSRVSGLWVVRLQPEAGERTGEGTAALAPIHYLVSGTVQRLGDRVRLHVQLTDSESGRQIWSERFDRASDALFEIQDEIGQSILRSLPVEVSEAERRRVAQRYTRNLAAYEVFQRGQLALHARGKAENESARELFRRAISLDATFARAYAGLAMTYAADYRNQWVEDGESALDRAFELVTAANQIDPGIPETHWVVAFVKVHRHQHEQALRSIEEALRLSPSFADGYATKGGIYTSTGRAAEAVPLLRIAMRLHPESGYLYFMLLGRAYLFLGDLEQAQVNLAHALSRNPAFLDARVYLAATLVETGDKPAAAWEAEEIRALRPDFNARRWLETNPTADRAMKARLVGALGELGF